MVHWSEGRPREHPRDNFPPRDAAPVRAFVAIRMSDAVEDAVAALTEELRRPGDGIAWVPRANLHVTLKFLGANVDPYRLEQLTEALHDLAARTAPFAVEATGAGAFPNLERPHVIWVGLHGVELGALAARVEAAAGECGFEREKHHWSGHLTIGRVRNPRGFSKTRAAIAAAKERGFGASRIESITLYRSHPGQHGSTYEALATFLFRHYRHTG